jgi:phage tail-like protein
MTIFANETSLLNLLPKTYRDADLDGSLQAFFATVDVIWGNIVTDMGNFDDSVIRPADSMLDYWLSHRGNPFVFPMTTAQKRQLVDGLFHIYQLRGSKQGLINAIRYMLGFECTFRMDYEYCWDLGTSKLGVNTMLLGAQTPIAHLVVPGSYPGNQAVASIRTICDFMKPNWLDIQISVGVSSGLWGTGPFGTSPWGG